MSNLFKITGKRHSIGRVPGFPDGIWYGSVDGWECTAPVWSEKMAIEHARHQLEHGGLRAALQTSINCMRGWISTGHDVDKATARIKEDSALLEKIEAAYASHHDSAR